MTILGKCLLKGVLYSTESNVDFPLQQIMKDKWMNMGYEDDEELVPFKEPTLDIGDTKRIDILVGMGYNRHEVEQSLQTHKFDDAYASYLLLGRRSTDVSAPARPKVASWPSAALSLTQSGSLSLGLSQRQKRRR